MEITVSASVNGVTLIARTQCSVRTLAVLSFRAEQFPTRFRSAMTEGRTGQFAIGSEILFYADVQMAPVAGEVALVQLSWLRTELLRTERRERPQPDAGQSSESVIITRSHISRHWMLDHQPQVGHSTIRIPYLPPQTVAAGGAVQWPNANYPIADSPEMVLTEMSRLDHSQQFLSFLMYRPEGAHSIWVSLAKIEWGWSANGELLSGHWQFRNGSPSRQSEIRGQIDTTLPEWQGSVYHASEGLFDP